ncbi:EpsG family protein [Sporosarcina gallistercoris]|uniref:EpsG family protein n=1 Tax=Sporosarcina gallistercoris TaxID=2762245 RepID=A0ABR8PML4_9BACL|nr:EpsG family protein [Sporosarcina gallistercoris]MBD7909420.1 EpsG family protein [Sporosarcina gallistercoris]
MILYIGIALFYIMCMLIEKILGQRINRAGWTVFLLLPLFVLVAFRAPTIGTDTLNYYQSYLLIAQESFFSTSASRLEFGYVMLARLISSLGLDFLGFQIVTTFFIFFSFGKFIYKYSMYLAFSVYFFVTSRMLFGTMNISRQYIAVAILLFSVDSLQKRRFVRFSIIVLLASFFHSTAIVFLIMYPLIGLKINFRKTIFIIGSGILSSIFFDYLIRIFINITGKYEGYLDGGYFNFEGNIAIYFNLLINFSFFIVGLVIGYWNTSKEINKNTLSEKTSGKNRIKFSPNEKVWYVVCLLALIVSIVGLNSTIMSRIELYFSVFFLAYIPSLIQTIKSKEIRVIISSSIIVGLFASFLVIMVYRPNWTTVFPYYWYWNW